MKKKRVVVVSDFHCGSIVGLTPPEYQTKTPESKFPAIREKLWQDYCACIDKYQPIDILIVNGDMIDGAHEAGGQRIFYDRHDQQQMAASCILRTKAQKKYLIRGTMYHVGDKEDWETPIKDMVKAEKVEDHGFFNINGVILDVKHKIGSSSVPHTQGTAVGRERLWNMLWADRDQQKPADILIRSHRHSFFFCGDDRWLGVITPAWQALGGRYGSRNFSTVVNVGLVGLNIFEDGTWDWFHDIVDGAYMKAHYTRISV